MRLALVTTTEIALDEAALAALIQHWLEADIRRVPVMRTDWLADDLAKHLVERASEWSKAL